MSSLHHYSVFVSLLSVQRQALVKLPGDTSVMTYTGHLVKNTLLRARFSPIATTGQVCSNCVYVRLKNAVHIPVHSALQLNKVSCFGEFGHKCCVWGSKKCSILGSKECRAVFQGAHNAVILMQKYIYAACAKGRVIGKSPQYFSPPSSIHHDIVCNMYSV